jgi:hypothetical protein
MGSHCEKVDVRADTPDPENCLFICAFSCLPAGLLGSGVSPLGGGGRGSGSASLPGGGLSLAPLGGGSGSREASRSSLPVTSTSGEAGLDGDRALLLNGGELLLLDLLLSLGLRVAVYNLVSGGFNEQSGQGDIQKYRSGMTSQGVSRLKMVPRRRRTSRASIHQTRPIEWRPLLLVGMATSTYSVGESVSQRAMTGMLTYEASLMAWASVRGSVTMIRRGSLNERVM